MKQTRRPRLVIAATAGVLLASVGIAAWLGRAFLVCHATARNARLTTCDSDTLAVALTCPGDHFFQLVLGIDGLPYKSDLVKPPSGFAGRIRIFEREAEILSFPISSETAQWCNWLSQDAGISAFVLSWHLPRNKDLDNALVPGRRYTIQLEYDLVPASATSLWFSWVQEHPKEYDLAAAREPARRRASTIAPVPATGPANE
jgi:hypothetical protein